MSKLIKPEKKEPKEEVELPKSPHWPGVGRYVGSVDDIHYKDSMLELQLGIFDEWNWQINRVYQDEIDVLNKGIGLNLKDWKFIYATTKE